MENLGNVRSKDLPMPPAKMRKWRKPRGPRKGKKPSARRERNRGCLRFVTSREVTAKILDAARHTRQPIRYCAEIVFEALRDAEPLAAHDLVRRVGKRMLQEALDREEQEKPIEQQVDDEKAPLAPAAWAPITFVPEDEIV